MGTTSCSITIIHLFFGTEVADFYKSRYRTNHTVNTVALFNTRIAISTNIVPAVALQVELECGEHYWHGTHHIIEITVDKLIIFIHDIYIYLHYSRLERGLSHQSIVITKYIKISYTYIYTYIFIVSSKKLNQYLLSVLLFFK